MALSTQTLLEQIRDSESSRTYINEPLKLIDDVTFNLNQDYSLGSVDARYVATADNTKITRLIVYIEDGGNWRNSWYGGLGSALTNGIKIYYKQSGGSKIYINPDIPVKSSGSYSSLMYDVTFLSFGAGDDALTCRFTFSKATPLSLDNGGEIGIELFDNLSNLTFHYFNVQGYVQN